MPHHSHQAHQALTIIKSLADQTRIEMLRILVKQGKEVACQDLSQCFKLSQPTLSHHFKKLVTAEIILERKKGVEHFYSVNTKLLRSFGIDLKQLLRSK